MTIEEMKERKKEMGYSYKQIAELSGLPVSTVQKVLGGITKLPRYDTIQALGKVFLRPDEMSSRAKKVISETGMKPEEIYYFSDDTAEYGSGKKKEVDYRKISAKDDFFRENTARKMNPPEDKKAFVKKKQGEYTLDDYYALPEEKRVELIDGVIYDMDAPTNIHQLIAGRIFLAFCRIIDKKRGRYIPFMSPVDVQLDMDNKTMVQPDVIVLCDRKKNTVKNIYGAPDLLVEVLSPSSAKRDMSIKFKKYRNAGVREYWIVDPDIEQIIVYKFEEEMKVTLYGAGAKVPIGIFNDEAFVDFAEIFEYIHSVFEEAETDDGGEY